MSDTNPGQQLAIVEPAPDSVAELPTEIPIEQLIVLRQIPVIEDKLHEYKATIENRVAAVVASAMDADSIAAVKKVRANLRKEAETVDNLRKTIKQEAEKPIKALDATFKDCATNTYAKADAILKTYVDNGENALKDACEKRLRELFEELTTARHLPWLKYEQAGIKVSLTDAKADTQPPKKLQTQITQYIESVAADVQTINGMDNAAEIMAEYRQCFNLTLSIRTVTTRHERIAAAQRAQEARNTAVSEDNQRAAAVLNAAQETTAAVPVAPAAVDRPIPVIPTPQTFRCRFEVEGTIEQLKLLKRFMNQNGFTYKDI